MWFFPLVIISGTCAPCRHLFISSACLLWMEVNFLNQKPCIPSWPGVFQFDIFSVILSKLLRISAFGPSWSPSNFFVILFIHSAFSLCFLGWHILVQNRPVSLASGCWYVFVSSSNCWKNFLLLWNVPFCQYCFTLCRYLFNLPSFASNFWFISSSYFFLCSLFLFVLTYSSVFLLFHHFGHFS